VSISVLITEDALRRRVTALAEEVRRDAGSKTAVHFVVVLKGALVFAADLLREVAGPVTMDVMAVSSYGGGRATSGEVRVTKDLDQPLAGRDVVLVDDIVDSGLTLAYLQDTLRRREPRSLRTACLLDKAARRAVDVSIDYRGFAVPDRFVVGYGMDLDERYRELPYIGVMGDDVR